MIDNIEIKNEDYSVIEDVLNQHNCHNVFLVCDNSLKYLKINKYLNSLFIENGKKAVFFSDFTPNPLYKSVESGVQLFNEKHCDSIFAVGGGSAIDVAKCIRIYCNMDHFKCYLDQKIISNDIFLMVMPTTAGTGSEATKFAVIYLNGEKISVSESGCLPDAVVFDPSVLDTLPLYQKKATMMDALCHSIESCLSVNSSDQSKQYAYEAIRIIVRNADNYLSNNSVVNADMLKASNLAGKAINITQTTAGHAMAYKLTTLYGIAHGHAVALCVSALLPFMVKKLTSCIEIRDREYLLTTLNDISSSFGCGNINEFIECFTNFVQNMEFDIPVPDTADFNILVHSVNHTRMKNFPLDLTEKDIDMLYHNILKT